MLFSALLGAWLRFPNQRLESRRRRLRPRTPSTPQSPDGSQCLATGRYSPPDEQHQYLLSDLLQRVGRAALDPKQCEMLRSGGDGNVKIYYSGHLDLLDAPAVSIVGTREVSEPGRKRAYQLARSLSAAGVTVVSGLAKGVDTAALTGVVDNGGHDLHNPNASADAVMFYSDLDRLFDDLEQCAAHQGRATGTENDFARPLYETQHNGRINHGTVWLMDAASRHTWQTAANLRRFRLLMFGLRDL